MTSALHAGRATMAELPERMRSAAWRTRTHS